MYALPSRRLQALINAADKSFDETSTVNLTAGEASSLLWALTHTSPSSKSNAIGAKTYKLKFGHRGGNQPVRDERTGMVEITSQNHGFAVDRESLEAAGGDGAEQRQDGGGCGAHARLDEPPEHPDPVDVEQQVERAPMGEDAGHQSPGLAEREARDQHEVLDAAAGGFGQHSGDGADDHHRRDGEALGVLEQAQGGPPGA